MTTPIRIAITGAGNRSLPKRPEGSHWLGWAELIRTSPGFELAGVQDIDPVALARFVERGLVPPERTFADLGAMLDRCPCDALLVTTPGAAHEAAVSLALERGLHVLVEKPLATSLEQGAALARRARERGLVAAVVQNWRSKSVGLALRKAIGGGSPSDLLGEVGHILFRYVRNRENPAYPAYIFQEPYPLLYAMGIHHFDLFRFILADMAGTGDEPATVEGRNFKPPWSLYDSWTGHSILIRTVGGRTISYTGTISSRNGAIPQESLVVEGERGTLTCDSDWLEPPLLFHPTGQKTPVDLTAEVSARSSREQYDLSDANILANFRDAVRGAAAPLCSAEDGLRSVALVEAARLACETGGIVDVAELVARHLGAGGGS
jgi:predicted dehydrogenase